MQTATLEADAAIDLQLHTVYSDGAWTPEELIDHLISEQFALAAITDHDRVDTVPALQTLAAEKGFRLVPAVEMSTRWRGSLVDVLVYGFDPAADGLRQTTAKLREQQGANIRLTVDSLRRQGYQFSDDDVQAILEKPSAQQPHALVDLLARLNYSTPDRSPARLLVDSGLEVVTLDTGEVVEAAHQSGGVCLIAHPGRGEGYVRFDAPTLDRLRAEIPIDGLEAYYPRHTAGQTVVYLRYAKQHDLLISAGSDSHKPSHLPVKYRAGWCRKLLNRLGIRVSDG